MSSAKVRKFQLESLGAEDHIHIRRNSTLRGSPAKPGPADGVGLTTAERLEESGWWPTKGELSRGEYSGSAACAGCHQRIA